MWPLTENSREICGDNTHYIPVPGGSVAPRDAVFEVMVVTGGN